MDPNQKGPFDEDILEPSKNKVNEVPEYFTPASQPPLMEKDFIQESNQPYSIPLWLWIALMSLVVALVWGGFGWYQGRVDILKSRQPFLEVTNREMSVFLWQFPSFIRFNVSKKAGYLPGFFMDRVEVDPNSAEEYVTAPPELLFLYHTWNRLLAPDYIARPISPKEFNQFLAQEEIWQPAKWKKAPKGYSELIRSKAYEKVENLETLLEEALPIIVRQAFQGWRNYYIDGQAINELNPTIAEVIDFTHLHPTYGRSYWRNIDTVLNQPIAGSNYLKLTLDYAVAKTERFPKEQLASFLKVAMFNFKHSQQAKPEPETSELPKEIKNPA